MTSEDMNETIEEKVEETIEEIHDTMESTEPDLASEIVDPPPTFEGPWLPAVLFWEHLSRLASVTQGQLSQVGWLVSPARFYRWVVFVLVYLSSAFAKIFDIPAWEVVQKTLQLRADSLKGTPTNEKLTVKMENWETFSFFTPVPPVHPTMPPDPGPYFRIVDAFNKIFPMLSAAASKLWHGETNTERTGGKVLTPAEAMDVVYIFALKCRDSSMFQYKTAYGWHAQLPWIDFVVKDLDNLKTQLKKSELQTPAADPDDVPFSVPKNPFFNQ